MAYVNVADWKPDQVADWLKGLDISIHKYVESFLNNHVNGQHLLNLQPDDLENHGIFKVGHQEIILEGVDHLRNFHYELDHENLQLLALRVSCLAHSLHKELWNSSPVVSTQTLSDIASIIKNVKPLVCWLDRPPFSGQLAYIDKKAELLKLSLEMATSGQRDRFAERPIESIRSSAKRLAELVDEMIREIHDPLLLQPASLDLATLKKRPGDHLGFCIIPSFHGNHQIGEIKCNSTAYQSGKIECGDEIVQINYQTVVGWDVKQVMALFEESTSDIFLTLKKRPCHSKILGQIYMKPYRLPSKKQVSYDASKWFLGDKISPPQINIRSHFEIKPLGNQLSNSLSTFSKNRKTIPEAITILPETDENTVNTNSNIIIAKEEKAQEGDDEDDGDEDNEQEEEEESISSPTSVRLYMPKPRLPVQRRATITGTGASPTSKRAPLNLEQLWHELKQEREWRLSGKQRKGEKSNSEILFSVSSTEAVAERKVNLKSSTKASSADCLKSVQSEFSCENKHDVDLGINLFIAENEVVGGKPEKEIKENKIDTSVVNVSMTNFMPLKERIEILNKNIDQSICSISSVKPNIPPRKLIHNENFSSLTNSPVHKSDKKPVARPRGKLDKANSTPVYDFNDKSINSSVIKQLFTVDTKNKDDLRVSNSERPKLVLDQIKASDVNIERKENAFFSKLLPGQNDENVNNSLCQIEPLQIISINSDPSKINSMEQRLGMENSSQGTSSNDCFFPMSSIPKDLKLSLVNPAVFRKNITSANVTEKNVPKPAIRVLKKEIPMSVNDSSNKMCNPSHSITSPNHTLSPGKMHLSEVKDSVFIDNAIGNKEENVQRNLKQDQNQVLEEKQQGLLTFKEKENDPPGVTSIVIRDSNNSARIKFIDDPESPTYLSNAQDVMANASTRETGKINSKLNLNVNPKLSCASGSTNQNVFLETSGKIFLCQISKESSGHLNPATRSLLSEPPNKEELLKKKSNLTQPNICYMTDNKIHVSIPSSQPDSFKLILNESTSTDTINKIPLSCSTPLRQFNKETSFCQQPATYPRKKPEEKSLQSLPSTSISQTSSLRAMLPVKSKVKPTSPKVFRKKINLLREKRRNISVKDMLLPDCEGWLFQRDRKISTVPRWIRGWFVIVGNNFYGFTDKESTKAHLFIYLPGFTVSPAVEVKSRKYALKIYHTGTTFYLAADSQDEFATWLNCLSLAIIAHDRSPVENITFSESEGEEKTEDKSDRDRSKDHYFSSPKVKKISTFFTEQLTSSSSKNDKKFSSLKKNKKSENSSDQGNSSLDRKYLRFLSGSNNVPVPTENFRSYRRAPPSHPNDITSISHENSIILNDSIANRTSPPLQLPPDMADYRLASLARAGHTLSRQREHNTTLEAFMISRQGEERRQNQQIATSVVIRPPQQFAPSAPNLSTEESVCSQQSTRQFFMPSTSQKDSDCRMSTSKHSGWANSFPEGSIRNCNTIPDIQTKRLKRNTSGATNNQPEDSNSLSELEESSEGSEFPRNTLKSSSSSKLKSFFSSSHWQDSSSKKILGSPRLKRVLFGEKSDSSIRHRVKTHPANNIRNESAPSVDLGQHTPDYPGLEYPPVFVPESYSLSYVTSILESRSSNPSSGNSNSTHENGANEEEQSE